LSAKTDRTGIVLPLLIQNGKPPYAASYNLAQHIQWQFSPTAIYKAMFLEHLGMMMMFYVNEVFLQYL